MNLHDLKYSCPECGCLETKKCVKKLRGGPYEMWLACKNCGWAGDTQDKIRTVNGWNDRYWMRAWLNWKREVDVKKRRRSR